MTYGPAFAVEYWAMFRPRTLRQFASEHRCTNTGGHGIEPCACHALARVSWWEAPRRSVKAELTAQSKRLAKQPAFPQPEEPTQ